MTKKEKLAYLAGIIDGEGNIRIDITNNPRKFTAYCGRLTVANTDMRLVNWCKENYGGFIWTRKREDTFAKDRGWKNCHHWIKMLNNPSLKFCKEVLPYLVVKKERMELVLEFLLTKSTNGVPITDKVKEQRIELVKKLGVLNKRGI